MEILPYKTFTVSVGCGQRATDTQSPGYQLLINATIAMRSLPIQPSNNPTDNTQLCQLYVLQAPVSCQLSLISHRSTNSNRSLIDISNNSTQD